MTTQRPGPPKTPTIEPISRAELLARQQSGVVARSQLYELGVTRGQVRHRVKTRRWRRLSGQVLAVHMGEVPLAGREWAAVLEAGPKGMLDGASALIAAGLVHFEIDSIRVSVPRGWRVRRMRGADIRQTRRWSAGDRVVGDGPPRVRPEVAAVRAALWAKTDKQAAYLLTLAVQQGLAQAETIALEMLRVRRDKRRRFIHAVLMDLLGGVRSIGEREFAVECRRRGLPEPTRQVLRRGKSGRYYLDVYWEQWGVAVEIDGIQHSWTTEIVGDALRHNDVTLQGAVVLRLPLLGLRVAPDAFFAQIEDALAARGCPLPGRRTA